MGNKVVNDVSNSTIRNPNSPLPEGWRWVRLGELFDVQQGVAMSPQRREGISPHSFLRTLNVLWEHIDLSMLDEMDFTDEEVTKLSLKRGDLLVCEGGEVGRTAIWRGELEGCLHQNHIHRLRRLNDNVVPDFYMYWMQAAFQVFGSYSGQESKTTIPNLSGSRLKSFTVPLLPVEEQRRIAAKIQELMTEVEHARTACEEQLEAAKVLPSSYLRQVFESEEAKKWERRRLGEVCEFSNGKFIRREEIKAQGIYPVYGANGLIGFADRILLDKSVIIVGRVGSCGEINKSSGPAWITDNTIVLAPLKDLDFDFLYLALKTLKFEELRAASVQPLITQSDLKAALISVPYLSEQKRIADELNDKIASVEKLKADIEKQFEAIKALPQAILRKAFLGEL